MNDKLYVEENIDDEKNLIATFGNKHYYSTISWYENLPHSTNSM